jgi:hypothetical protein
MKVIIALFLFPFSALVAEENQKLSKDGVRVLSSLAAERGMQSQEFLEQLPKVDSAVIRHQLVVLESLLLLGEVERLLVVRGAAPRRACGGQNYHRILWVFKGPLRELVREHRGIGPSKDLAGPHPGTDLSFETIKSRPGMQFHTFRQPPSQGQLAVLARRFEVSLESLIDLGDRIVEADIDYDWKHQSNPGCLVRSVKGTIGHWLIPVIPGLFAEPATRRFNRVWPSTGIQAFTEVRP